jgi:uncharacterized protein
MHQHGDGTPKDQSEAERCYKQAMQLGHSSAQFYLARLYVENNNYHSALPLFEAAAERGHLPAIYWTGRLYLEGQGAPKDLQKAERYLAMAANGGHMFARRDYSSALFHGAFGKRQLIRGLAGRLSVVWAGARLVMTDPDSELLQ